MRYGNSVALGILPQDWYEVALRNDASVCAKQYGFSLDKVKFSKIKTGRKTPDIIQWEYIDEK
jgi:hypothetical protein